MLSARVRVCLSLTLSLSSCLSVTRPPSALLRWFGVGIL